MQLIRFVLILFTLICGSCGAIRQTLDVTPAPLPEYVANPKTVAPVQPAPAEFTKAQQRLFYQAQLDAQASPSKVKNSHNTDVQQTVHTGISTPQLLISWLIFFVMGGVFTFGFFKLRKWAIVAGVLLVATSSCSLLSPRPYGPKQYRRGTHRHSSTIHVQQTSPLPNSAYFGQHLLKR